MLTKHLVPEKEQVLYKVTCSFVLLILSLFYFHNFIFNFLLSKVCTEDLCGSVFSTVGISFNLYLYGLYFILLIHTLLLGYFSLFILLVPFFYQCECSGIFRRPDYGQLTCHLFLLFLHFLILQNLTQTF